MGRFLRGFADELIKIAGSDAWPGLRARTGTATGYEKPQAAPAGAVPPNPQVRYAIQKQRMDIPASTKQDGWRPGPNVRIEKPKPAPVAPKPKAVGKKVAPARPGLGRPAFETDTQTSARLYAESANQSSIRHQPYKPESILSYKKLNLRPGEKTKSELQKLKHKPAPSMAEQVEIGRQRGQAIRNPGAAKIDIPSTENIDAPRGTTAKERMPIDLSIGRAQIQKPVRLGIGPVTVKSQGKRG